MVTCRGAGYSGNPIYIGTLVQGKRGTPNYKIKQMKLRSKEDWCVVEKNHAPIIGEELFTSVQHLLSLDTRTSPSEEVVQPLAGMLYCADCGRAMCRRSVKRGNRMFTTTSAPPTSAPSYAVATPFHRLL